MYTVIFIILLSFCSLFQGVSLASTSFYEDFRETQRRAGGLETSVPLNKPKGIKALAWLQQLEDERDKAELNHHFDSFEALSREISSTLAGKYGFLKRVASSEERQLMFGSVIRTRDYFAGKPDIINDFYFSYDQTGCWKRVETDQTIARHMGIIVAADAMRFGVINRDGFEGAFEKQRQLGAVEYTFIAAVETAAVHTHHDKDEIKVKNVIETLSISSWNRLVQECGLLADITAPKIGLVQVVRELLLLGDTDYKGWKVHGLSAFSQWMSDGSEAERSIKQADIKSSECEYEIIRGRNGVLPTTFRGVLLDVSQRTTFKNLDDKYFDGKTIGLVYYYYSISTLKPGVDVQPIPLLAIYLTRKAQPSLNLNVLSKKQGLEQTQKKVSKTAEIIINRLGCAEVNYRIQQGSLDPNLEHLLNVSLHRLLESDEAVDLYMTGISITANPKQARDLLKKAADRGFCEGFFSYLSNVEHSSDKLTPEQLRLYSKQTSWLHSREIGKINPSERELRESLPGTVMKFAMRQNYIGCLTRYAIMCGNGEGGPKDYDEAIGIFKYLANSLNNEHAKQLLAQTLQMREREAGLRSIILAGQRIEHSDDAEETYGGSFTLTRPEEIQCILWFHEGQVKLTKCPFFPILTNLSPKTTVSQLILSLRNLAREKLPGIDKRPDCQHTTEDNVYMYSPSRITFQMEELLVMSAYYMAPIIKVGARRLEFKNTAFETDKLNLHYWEPDETDNGGRSPLFDINIERNEDSQAILLDGIIDFNETWEKTFQSEYEFRNSTRPQSPERYKGLLIAGAKKVEILIRLSKI